MIATRSPITPIEPQRPKRVDWFTMIELSRTHQQQTAVQKRVGSTPRARLAGEKVNGSVRFRRVFPNVCSISQICDIG
jgi:hypothetical protein